MLGSGMFGTVFEGEISSKPCAVKVLREIGTQISMNLPTVSEVQEARLNSFERELSALVNLKHPNIVELLHVCPYPKHKWPCLVMELLDCSLQRYLEQTSDHLKMKSQISLSCDIAKALAFLHKNNIIHRDLCGGNVLLQKRSATIPVAKIADFGMSRIIDPVKMTHTFSVLNHRNGYLPPEGPSQDYDLSLDVHMFGVIMVQIVHAVKDIKSPEERNELINKVESNHPLKQLINFCVAITNTRRPNAEAVCQELQNLLHKEQTTEC